MAFDYGEMQGIARELLTEFKQGTIQIEKVTPGNGPVYKPGPSGTSFTTVPGAVARNVKGEYVTLGLAVATDRQFTMAPFADAVKNPVETDFVLVDGVRFKIVKILPVPPAGTVVVYHVIFRK